MKKLLSALLAGVMLVSFASCDAKKNETKDKEERSKIEEAGDKIDGDSTEATTTEEETTSNDVTSSTETTTEPTKVKSDFKNMTATVLSKMGDTYTSFLNITYMDNESIDLNKDVGVVSLAYVWSRTSFTEGGNGEKITKEHNVDIYFLEFDKNSDEYSKLSVGKMLTFFMNGYAINAEVTAINNQYVLCMIVKDFDNGEYLPLITQPVFEDKDLQNGYDTFTSGEFD